MRLHTRAARIALASMFVIGVGGALGGCTGSGASEQPATSLGVATTPAPSDSSSADAVASTASAAASAHPATPAETVQAAIESTLHLTS